MPDKEVKTIKDLIYYQYAKIIAKSAFLIPDGEKAKKGNYGFIKNKFRELKNGKISWPGILREDWQLVKAKRECIYCGSKKDLQKEHLVPKSLHINSNCSKCDKIQNIHNQVWACKDCNSLKGTKGLCEFYKVKFNDEKKFYDFIPQLAEKKYLKIIYCCHECAGTLDKGDLNWDGKLDVLDLDYILHDNAL